MRKSTIIRRCRCPFNAFLNYLALTLFFFSFFGSQRMPLNSKWENCFSFGFAQNFSRVDVWMVSAITDFRAITLSQIPNFSIMPTTNGRSQDKVINENDVLIQMIITWFCLVLSTVNVLRIVVTEINWFGKNFFFLPFSIINKMIIAMLRHFNVFTGSKLKINWLYIRLLRLNSARNFFLFGQQTATIEMHLPLIETNY